VVTAVVEPLCQGMDLEGMDLYLRLRGLLLFSRSAAVIHVFDMLARVQE
jgi:hypothetical protein